MEASAKSATNVEQAFMAMAAEIKNRYFLFHYSGSVATSSGLGGGFCLLWISV